MSNRKPGFFRMQFIGLLLLVISIVLTIIFSDSIVLPERIQIKPLKLGVSEVPEGILLLKTIVLHIILVTLIFGLYYLLDIYRIFERLFGKYVDIYGIKQFFLSDRLCAKKHFPMFMLVTGTLLGTILQLFFMINGEPRQEGLMEHISEWILMFAAISILIATLKVSSNPLFHEIKIKTIILMLVIAFGLFFLLGEEISWGQRIFGFESFGVFQRYNYQQETNLHNFLNPLFIFIYPLVGMSSFFILVLFWFFKKDKSDLLDLLLPPPSLFFLLFIMACATYMGHSEIYEELLYVFALLYGIRMLVCLSYPPVDAGRQGKTTN
jgi:hypothetical protein